MCKQLEGRVIIVTGGGHGIGKAYCKKLGAEGARVVIAEIDIEAAERTAQELAQTGAEALAIRTDVSDEASTQEMATKTLERFGRIDVLINNAAVFTSVPMSRAPIEGISVQEWDRLMAVNLRGTFLASKAVIPAMKRQGRGKIINISSGRALGATANSIHYVTSKAGALGFTRTLACEVGSYGITVNALAPGGTLADENPTEKAIKMRQARIDNRPLSRVELPSDLVGPLTFLCSEDSDFMTGQTVVVDGGNTMH